MSLAIILLLAHPAAADDMPRFDPYKYCNDVAAMIGGSVTIENGCIEQEQQAYDRLKSKWSTFPTKTRIYCEEIAKTIGGSYPILEGCIQQETDALSNRPTFRY